MIIGVVCDFMFCNTCILFFELSFFGLGPELESDQASQPLALLCPPNLAWKDKEWTKVGSKWKCKVGTILLRFPVSAEVPCYGHSEPAATNAPVGGSVHWMGCIFSFSARWGSSQSISFCC